MGIDRKLFHPCVMVWFLHMHFVCPWHEALRVKCTPEGAGFAHQLIVYVDFSPGTFDGNIHACSAHEVRAFTKFKTVPCCVEKQERQAQYKNPQQHPECPFAMLDWERLYRGLHFHIHTLGYHFFSFCALVLPRNPYISRVSVVFAHQARE